MISGIVNGWIDFISVVISWKTWNGISVKICEMLLEMVHFNRVKCNVTLNISDSFSVFVLVLVQASTLAATFNFKLFIQAGE